MQSKWAPSAYLTYSGRSSGRTLKFGTFLTLCIAASLSGYLLFWENANADGNKNIGTDGKQKTPQILIVDGQQRLTSLYAVIKGVPVVRENYEPEAIEIAFNPLLEKFEVADAAIRKDKSYMPNISVIWAKETDLFELVDSYLDDLATAREIPGDEKKRIRKTFSSCRTR